eukprot:scaffold124952_cov63-Phaeocystis_antarctica.AAC.2
MVSPTQCAAAQYPPAHASTRRICQCTCWHVQRRTARPPICRCELHLQHQISCRVFGMGGAIEQAIENGVRDGYGRSAELLDAYLRRGGGDSREDAVLVDATPDTAVSVGSLVRDLTEKLRFDGIPCACARPSRLMPRGITGEALTVSGA